MHHIAILTSIAVLAGALGSQSLKGQTLRDVAGDRLRIGAALMARDLDNPRYADLLATQLNCVTPENELKGDATQPAPGRFSFERADKIVDFAQRHQMKVIGHTLLWHQQSPRWLFETPDGKPLPREIALANLRERITTMLTHYRGKIAGWDVVNEALSDSPNEYLRDTPARRAIGDDYIIQAFRIAQEADPDVELYYNDYNIELPYKHAKAMRLLRELKDAGVRVDAVGVQGHWQLGSPSVKEIDDSIKAFASLDIRVMITELDVDVLPRQRSGADLSATEEGANPYVNGLPADVAEKQAERYRAIFDMLGKHIREGTITRVTFWGLTDGQSWLNGFPVRGRTNHPLLWDRDYQPKPAFDAALESLRSTMTK